MYVEDETQRELIGGDYHICIYCVGAAEWKSHVSLQLTDHVSDIVSKSMQTKTQQMLSRPVLSSIIILPQQKVSIEPLGLFPHSSNIAHVDLVRSRKIVDRNGVHVVGRITPQAMKGRGGECTLRDSIQIPPLPRV